MVIILKFVIKATLLLTFNLRRRLQTVVILAHRVCMDGL